MPEWSSAADWDNAVSESGVVHQSVTGTDHADDTIVKQGYDYASFGEITPTPVACYPLHEDSGTTATDVAGANDGTVTGATPGGATGVLGTSAYSFDGDDHVALATRSSLGIDSAAALSVAFWVRHSGTGARVFVGERNAADNTDGTAQWLFGQDILSGSGGQLVVQFRDEDGNVLQEVSDGTGQTTGGSLHRVAFTYDGGTTATMYVDGSAIASTTAFDSGFAGLDDASGSNPVYVGAENDQGTAANHFTGDLTDVRFYAAELTAAQVQTDYDVVGTAGSLITAEKTL